MKLLLVLFSLGVALPVFAQTNSATLLGVASYNIRYASSTPPNAWTQRRPLVAEVIRSLSPDVLATQEGL